jgi:hypothetical protein
MQLKLNQSEPLWFILDTGFDDNIISADIPKKLDIELRDKKLIPQPGGSIEMGNASNLTFRLKGLTLINQKAKSAPLASLEPIIGRKFDGILGHDFISQFVIEIDYRNKILKLHQAKSFNYQGSGSIIPVTVIKREPFIFASIVQANRKPIPGKFKIDTGSVDTIGLNKNYFEDNQILPKDGTKLAEPGIGGGGETSGFSFRINGFQIGNFYLNDLAIGVTTDSGGFENRDDAGTFGAKILSRFKVILDYPRDRMILEKRKDNFDKPFTKDMSGLRIVTDSKDFNTFKVSNVLPKTPGAEAGFQKGDIILKINDQPTSKMKLSQIWKMFSPEKEKTFNLVIKRNDTKMIKQIKLRKLI